MKKILMLILLVILVTGCSSHSNADNKKNSITNDETPTIEEKNIPEIYRDLEAEDIYKKAIDKMNNEVSYVKIISSDSSENRYLESNLYCKNKRIKAVYIMVDDTFKDFNYNVSTIDKDYIIDGEMGPNAVKYFEFQKAKSYLPIEETYIYNVYMSNNIQVKKIFKSVHDKKFSLVLHQEIKKDNGEIEYFIEENVINEDGFIEEYIYTQTNEQFEDINAPEYTRLYSNFGEKSVDDFDKEVKMLQSCKGLTTEEVIKKIGLRNNLIK